MPVTDWIRANFHVDYVDAITEPGADKLVSTATPDELESIRNKVMISIRAHKSKLVAVIGHHDCAGNPVSNEEHLEMIRNAVEVVSSWELSVTVIGLWVNEHWQVSQVN